MSGSDAPRSAARRSNARLALGLWLGLLAAIAPLLEVISPGLWVLGATALPALLLTVSVVARRLRVPAAVVTIIEAVIWTGAITTLFFRHEAVFGAVPSPEVLSALPMMVQRASNEILIGVAPMTATIPLSFAVVASIGLLTVALDHVVLTARMPLLAGVALIAVWLIPAIAVPREVNVVGFALLGASLLYLIRAETRTREKAGPVRPDGSPRSGGVAAVTAGIAVIAIVAGVIGGGALPQPVTAAGRGTGFAVSIDPTLELGDDLRRRSDAVVLETRTDAPTMPYLRVATLSVFDGAVWQPDRTRSVSIADEGFDEVVADEGIRITEYRTHVRVGELNSAYLPVPFAIVDISGLDGIWRAAPNNRTVLTGQSNAYGQEYDVVTRLVRPTLEQIRAADADIARTGEVDVWSLPEQTPPSVAELATQVTADATTDYDRLVALQDWFRGPEFSYSLTAPVQAGFDGTGVDAVEAFLQQKTGYCIHFSAAFALMARTLGMPSRIVVGFLPGAYTGAMEDGQRVAEVSTDQLHAWPEVHFEGIGWIPFEPTKGLGRETQFLAAAQTPVDDGGVDVAGPTPSARPTSTATTTPTAAARPDQQTAAEGPVELADLRPYLATVLTLLVLAVLPLVGAGVRRAHLRQRARGGQVGAAWRIVQDTAIDLGVSVPAAESPRAFGARLTATLSEAGAETAAGAVARLIDAVERVSYGPVAPAAPLTTDASSVGASLAADAGAVRAGLLAAADGPQRAFALMLPRSLVVRPGSALAVREGFVSLTTPHTLS